MNKSRQKKSNVLLHSHLKQCLILVLAFLMVFQFSAPAYNLRAYAEDDTQTRLIEQLATDQAEMQEKTADDEMQANEKGEAQASDQDAESAEANAEDEHASDEPETSGKESNKTDASNSKESDTEADESETGSDAKDTSSSDAKDTADSENTADKESSESDSTEPEELVSVADYIASDEANSPRAALVQGEAALSKDAAAKALREDAGLSKKKATSLAEEIFEAADASKKAGEEPTRDDGDSPEADGSEIEYVIAAWMNPNTNDSNAVIKPSDDNKQSVRIKVSYGLSGQHGYKAGDVTISIPANLFQNRNGKNIGKVVIPYPEDPSTQGDYSWRREGDYYILTNNKDLIASAKGFVEFDITGIYPHDLVDMDISNEFKALVQVVNHAGNTMMLHSNELTAQFDTDAKINKVTKKLYDEPEIVSLTNVPQGMESESGKYVKVTWYVTVLNKANTYYKLDYVDTIPTEETNNEGETYRGFIINATTEDGHTLEKNNAYAGYQTDKLITYKVQTAYPLEQFEEEHSYIFHNNIEFTLTEKDDPTNTSTKSVSATGTWDYTHPEYPETSGHFMLFKNGNDGKSNGNKTNYSGKTPVSDLHMWSRNNQGWFGLYSSALNDMLTIYEEDGENGYYDLSYTVNTAGFTMPWMFDENSYDSDEEGYPADAPKYAKNYTDSVTMITKDWGISIGRKSGKLAVKDEFKYKSVEFPADPYVYKGYANKIYGDGSFAPQNPKDKVIQYIIDANKENWPDIELEILRAGEWEDWAIASWKSGSFKATLANGETQTDRVIDLPEDTESFRTIVTNENTATEGKTITQAAIDYDVRVVVGLRTTERMMNRINSAFATTNMPKFYVYNRMNLTATEEGNPEPLVDLGTENYSNDSTQNKDGYDVISGYNVDTMTYPMKKSEFDIDKDWNIRDNSVTIHYTAKVEERSFISSKTTWQEAVNDGSLVSERHGVWRDLLPEGMTVNYNSILLRPGDNIVDIRLTPDYHGSGRTLLEVEVDLKPAAEKYVQDGISYYMDVPSISFDGVIDLDSVRDDYLDNPIHNVISFESDNDTIGTVEGYSGEPDDPYSTNNVATAEAFKTALEKNAMTNLDPDRDTPSFVYAGSSTTIDIPGAAISGLEKRVMTNYDEIWSTGVYGKDPEGNRRDVYAGGVYSYRISYMPQALDTVAKDIILYDSLDNYHPVEGNDNCDIDAPRWKGTLKSVDTRHLENKGCAPVVYYYTGTDELDLAHGFVAGESLGNMDLSKDIWVKATDYTGELSDVTAVAVDASKDKDGNDFIVEPEDAIYVIINMNAPTVDDDGTVNDEFGNNIYDIEAPHAYNNVYAMATSIDTVSGQEDPYQFIHNEYTKVGLKTYDLSVNKVWNDDNDRDGLRPDTVTINLMADGKKVDSVTLPYTENSDDEPRWDYTFSNLRYTDNNGNIIHYTFKEAEVPNGYNAGITINGNTYTVKNTHVPEKVSISGTKTWVGDNTNIRPTSFVVKLYADNLFLKQQTVTINSTGSWEYAFTGLNKYRDHGEEIIYTVKEDMSGSIASYECEIDGYDIINTYHPYGDLKVTKTVTNTTPQSENKTFVFGFEFTKTVTTDDGTEEDPVGTPFEYDILDENGDVIEGQSGTITTSQTLEIKGGQTIHVKEINEYVNYRVYEEETAGFELVKPATTQEVTGTIQPNDTQKAEFINKYSTDGSIEFNATKVLYGHELQRYKFHYGIYELTRNEDGHITDSVLKKTGYSDTSEETITNDDGQVVSATAPIRFGQINYTQEDNGKTFYYKMVEYKGKNEHEDAAAMGNVIDGYVYDETVYYATVTVTDNGDGTMDTAVVYTDEDGTPLEGGDDPEFIPLFENRYKAEGSVDFKVWKDLKGRKVQDEEFEFELLDSEGYPLTLDEETGKAVRITDPENQIPIRAKNDETSTVAFDNIRFDQADIGKSYYFAFREVIPEEPDTSITYDMNVYGYKVTVKDNDDGTLSCSVLKATPLDEEGNQAKQDESGNVSIANWTEENAGLPVFENKLKPGGFSVTKLIDNPDEAPNQQFHFKVKLIGDDIPDTLEYDLSQVGQGEEPGEPEPDPDEPQPDVQQAADGEGEEENMAERSADNEAPAENSEPGVVSHTLKSGNLIEGIIGKLLSLVTDKAYCAEGDDEEERSTEGTAYAVLDKDGNLILFRSYDTYTHNSEGTFTDIFDNTYTGRVFTAIETTNQNSTNNSRWYNYNTQVMTVRVADGQLIKPKNCHSWFNGCSNMTDFDPDGLDTSIATSMGSMFLNCSSLITLDLSGFKTSKVTSMSEMFNGCSKLSSIDFKYFNTNNVTTMYKMFNGCGKLEKLDLSCFNTENVTSMAMMFNTCTSLETVNISNFKTPKVTSMNGMFKYCSKLQSLDLSTFYNTPERTTALTDMYQMFQKCEQLKSIDFSNFNSSKVKNMRETFDNCRALLSLDLSSFNTKNVTNMCCTFCNCSSLTELKLANFETPKVTRSDIFYGFDRTFKGCSNLKYLDIRNFTVTTANTRQLFDECSKLSKVELGEGMRFNDTSTSALLPKPPTNSTYTGKWIMETEDYGPYTPAQVAAAFNGTSNPVISTSALAGTWIWEKKSSQYTILFAAPEEATGSMPKVKAESAEPFEIPENKFYWFKHAFSHWTDGRSRAIYEDKGTIPANTYAGNDRVTLTAVFTDLDTTVTLEDGQFDLYLYGNEMATFTDLPAGTAYQVWEETPDGWVLIKQENTSGSIKPEEISNAVFTNRYQPGTVTAQFSGTKKLDNKAAEAGSFQFELTEKNNEGGSITIINDEGEYEEKTLPLIATVIEGGFIQFPVIRYTQDDVGEHDYIIREVDPNLDTIDYDTHKERITVTITENEDSTLSSAVEYDKDGISFTNKTRPGVLKIKKVGENVTKQNADDEFTFKVTLYNEDGQPIGDDEGIYWYTLDSDGNVIGNDDGGKNILEKASAKAAEVWDDVKTWASDAWDDVREAFTVENAYGAEGDPNEGRSTEGTAYAVLDKDGNLILFRSYDTYTHNSEGTFTDIFDNTYTGRVFTAIETTSSNNNNNSRWLSYNTQIKTVRVADGQLIKPKNCRSWFYGCSNMIAFNQNGLDTSIATSMSNMFQNCSSLTTLDLSRFRTPNVTNMGSMFNGCGALTSLDVTNFNTQKVTSMGGMFINCYELRSLDLSSFITPELTGGTVNMFSKCKKLEFLDISNFVTSKLTDMSFMFEDCNVLQELNLSSFDTKNVTNMSYMFIRCYKLKSITFSDNFKTPKVTTMASMFRDCRVLTSLDLSSFEVSAAANTARMFENCSKLCKVELGEGMRFNDTGTSSLLPTPPSNSTYTGRWIMMTEAYGPYTPTQVAAAFNGTSNPVIPTAALAGTWVWQVKSNRCVVQFDASGGYTGQGDIVATSATQSITMPDSDNTFYLHYILTGWNTEKDGSGTAYEAGSTYDNVVQLGKTVILYAQWEATNLREYRVEHYQQNTDLETYTLADSETLMADCGTSVTPEVKSYKNFIIPEAQTVTVEEDDSTIVKYYYDRFQYKINFDGNGANSGIMNPIDMIGGMSKKLPKNTYSKVGSLFTGWSDGRRAMYSDQQQVVDLSEDGSDVTLYAQWMDNPNEPLEPTNGEIYVHCKAGETIVIPDLPAGTKYTIEEINVPDGWTLSGEVGKDGTVIANGESEATFTNTYKAVGEIQLEANKKFTGDTLTDGQFEFGVYEGNNLIATGHNDEKGHIVFEAIQYSFDDIDDHNYIIREIVPENSDQNIAYDTHSENVTVKVADGGHGILDVTAEYDEDGAIFTNEMKPGSLKIDKAVTNGSPDGKEFEFRVQIFDKEGVEDTDLEFKWKAYDAENTLYGNDIARSGVVIKIDSGDHIIISDLPAGYSYKVSELDKTGWMLVSKDGDEGIISSNETSEATFTNEYYVEGEAVFEADKQLTNKKLEADMFHFGIYDEDGNLVSSGTNDKDGHIVFDPIKYYLADDGKTYSYTISEIEEKLDGVTYSTDAYNVTVSIEDNGNGTMSISKGGEYEDIIFKNVYDAKGDVTFSGTKLITGRELNENDQFTFVITEEGTENVWRCTNDATGKIKYPKIEYTYKNIGKHTYTIKESPPDENGNSFEDIGIDVDDTEYTVVIEVSDNGDGTLKVEQKGGSNWNNLNFFNTYEAEGSITLSGSKIMDGRTLAEGESYEFTLYNEEGEVVYTTESGENGAYVFDPLTYTQADDGKTFKYTVKETSTGGNGVTIDTTEYTVTVKVKDLGNGKLEITPTVNKEGVTYNHLDFTNTYTATGKLELKGTKTLTGRALTANDKFTFKVTETVGGEEVTVSTGTNDQTGKITFTDIEYTNKDRGMHTYTVKETSTDGNGITVDTKTYTVIAEVIDDGLGHLTAAVQDGSDDPEALDFENVYEATGSVQFEARKELLGRVLSEGEFEFGVYKDGELISKANNDNDGKIVFNKINYGMDDRGKTYEYIVKELPGDVPGVTYDENEFKITVSITDNLDGTLKVDMDTDEEIVFVNPYAAEGALELSGTKTIEGRDMTDDDIFQFAVSEDGEVIQTAENDADGNIDFEEISYTLDDVGTHTYTVKETAGDEENMTYDDTEYTVEVKVSDNGDGTLSIEIAKGSDDPEELDFVNEYKPEKPIDPDPDPETGDTTNIVPYACGFGAGLIALIIVLFRRKKKDK